MIFATVGTQLPFPRLLDALEATAERLDLKVLAQTGAPPQPNLWPHVVQYNTLDPADFEAKFRSAELVVSHAGMGTILSARRFGKPLIVLPRRHDLGEHRNDHQISTARALQGMTGLHIAWETADLERFLIIRAELAPANDTPGVECDRLIAALAAFIAAP